MLRTTVMLVATAATLLGTPGMAAAEPAAPQADSPCPAEQAQAMTFPPDTTTPLVCDGTRWESDAEPYPISERWVSYGPALTLHGQGRRNPNLLSGDWTATPIDDETSCRAVQYVAIPGLPEVGEPRTDSAPAGQQLSVRLELALVSLELSGDCLWQRVPT